MTAAFNPWTATFDEARAAQPEGFDPKPDLPLYQWNAAREVEALRPSIERGDGFAVLDAVSRCALHGLVIPDWLAREYLRRYRAVQHCRVRSWDEAFGRPYPPGTNIAARRRAQKNRIAASLAFHDILISDPARTVDKGLFEEIGKRIGEGATRAEDLYREALQLGIGQTAAEIRGFLQIKPTKSGKLAGIRRRR